MNQSNKALRDEVADLIESTGIEDHNHMWHRDSSLFYADQILALVTNHIKGKMPKTGKYPDLPLTDYAIDEPMFNPKSYTDGYWKAIDEVHQLLKEIEEVSNADQ